MKCKPVGILLLVLMAALMVMMLGACGSTEEDSSESTAVSSTDTTAPGEATTSSLGTAPSSEATPSTGPETTTDSTVAVQAPERQTLEIGDVAKVEQGHLSVSKITVTDDLASDEANELLLTGEEGEGKNVSKAPGDGNEFLLVTFMYKKAEWYEFRGGLYPEDVFLTDAEGPEYLPVETKGHGGVFETNAADVAPNVEAFTTAVFEVPEGSTGLVLTYHPGSPDGFYVNIR